MENRVGDKTKEIDSYLEELESFLPESLEAYKKQLDKKAACERYFEKIVEAVVDLAFLIIKKKKLKSPDNDKHAFEILENSNLLSHELSERLQDAKSMRNIIAHEYGEIDDEKVFHAVTEELIPDTKKFLGVVG
ncbi:hypothetical protein CMI37_19335 [Candidatus Pacearchaeota archaeon]|nr:hypothetical protein [Candidatus Pacearchaeota archaeon]|tara:strand:+ start:3211 stop:3612 length:402 start_codon:yes stop_codon:yes gene_type:complete